MLVYRSLSREIRINGSVYYNDNSVGIRIVIMLIEHNEYRDGDIMEVVAEETGVPSIEKGKRIITNVIKPQINHNNKMIQRAKVKLKSNL